MDKNLLPYFESVNDGGEQSQYLAQFGNKEVQNGICLHLAIAWLYFYKQQNGAATPNAIWQQMKTPNMISQIANNQRAYIKNDFSVNECLEFYKLLNCKEETVTIADDIPSRASVTLQRHNMNLVILELSKGGKIAGRHAIALIHHKATDKVCMYDPNIGVLTAPIANQQMLIGQIKYYYETKLGYRITGEKIIEVV